MVVGLLVIGGTVTFTEWNGDIMQSWARSDFVSLIYFLKGSSGCVCLRQLCWHNKIPQTGHLKQQKCIFPWFQRLQVGHQGASRREIDSLNQGPTPLYLLTLMTSLQVVSPNTVSHSGGVRASICGSWWWGQNSVRCNLQLEVFILSTLSHTKAEQVTTKINCALFILMVLRACCWYNQQF